MKLIRTYGRTAKAVATAESFLAGRMTAIEACHAFSVISPLDLLPPEDRNLFIGVASETDDLPVGALQQNWHPDFLQAKLKDLANYEAKIVDQVRSACLRVVELKKHLPELQS
jgi:hypothetical protein